MYFRLNLSIPTHRFYNSESIKNLEVRLLLLRLFDTIFIRGKLFALMVSSVECIFLNVSAECMGMLKHKH